QSCSYVTIKKYINVKNMEIVMNSNNEMQHSPGIISGCNTCREPIYVGETIYSSFRQKKMVKSGGLYEEADEQVSAPSASSQAKISSGASGRFGGDANKEV
ncbi:13376_t:CDS:1, partial [Gigaspora margarita]